MLDLKKVKALNGKSLNQLSQEQIDLFNFLQTSDNKILVKVSSEAPLSELSNASSEKHYYEILNSYSNSISIDIKDDNVWTSTDNQSNQDNEILIRGDLNKTSIIETVKKSVLFWIIVVAAIGSFFTSENKNTKRDKQPTISTEQKNISKKLIVAFGYKCDKIDSIIRSEWDGDYSITCNDYRYSYEIEDKGGNWVVTLNN